MIKKILLTLMIPIFLIGCYSENQNYSKPYSKPHDPYAAQRFQQSMQNLSNNMLRLDTQMKQNNRPIYSYPVGGSRQNNSNEWQERRARQQYYQNLGY
jgi:hypothetical protein